ncbi:hypothetical protein OJF2_49100 [Aquisphaera giovannonii]|uniref:DUF104 domain-containing protein n=1 Tax=Aquisphaera giovannonii TaxID=406548 RepID=A0A5B9W879_9BACT|nr:hypothetical protein [Aquisphaera giovannonii]QEH36349.1 hypothetical protein OJF2_49100 [Aquisphaera giovannonii]
MSTIRGVVRDGRIEIEEPLDLPEGTELLIPIPDPPGDEEPGWDNSPEGIAAWLGWADSLEPLLFNEKEEAEAEDWLKRCDHRAAETLGRDVEGLFR